MNLLQMYQEKLEFYTNERIKWQAQADAFSKTQQILDSFLHPTLLLAQSLLFQLNETYLQIEAHLAENLDGVIEGITARIENVFLNYLSIIKLRSDIQSTTSPEQQNAQLQQFQANLERLIQSQPQFIAQFYDVVVLDFAKGIDEAFHTFESRFQELLQLLDSIQVKMTQFHGHANQTGITQDLFQKLAQITQHVESQKSLFVSHIHEEISKQCHDLSQNINGVLSTAINFIQNYNTQGHDQERVLNELYEKLIDYKDTINSAIQTLIEEIFGETIIPLDTALTNFTNYCQSQFEPLFAFKLLPDPLVTLSIAKIDGKIAEIVKKIAQLRKEEEIK